MSAPKITDDGPRGADLYRLDRAPETTRDRVQRLQHEARLLAREEVQSLETKLAECIAMARSPVASWSTTVPPAPISTAAWRRSAPRTSR